MPRPPKVALAATRMHLPSSAGLGLQRGDALLDLVDPLVEIAGGGAHHHQHSGGVAALLTDQTFHPLVLHLVFQFELPKLGSKRTYTVLNFDQDLGHCIGWIVSHQENITETSVRGKYRSSMAGQLNAPLTPLRPAGVCLPSIPGMRRLRSRHRKNP